MLTEGGATGFAVGSSELGGAARPGPHSFAFSFPFLLFLSGDRGVAPDPTRSFAPGPDQRAIGPLDSLLAIELSASGLSERACCVLPLNLETLPSRA